MELLPLGTNGFFPSFGRQTMSFLLLEGEQAVLLDAGTGVGRLAEPALSARLAHVERLDIVLTHYHLDHVAGLTYLTGAWGKAARIFAPAPPLVDAEPRDALARLIGPPLFPLTLEQYPTPIELVPYSEELTVLGHDVRLRRNRHPGGSVGMVLGPLAYVTDTIADDAVPGFVDGAELLLHEVWAKDAEARERPHLVKGHSAAGAVAALAERAGVPRLAPVHHHPRRSAAELDEVLDEVRAAAPSVETVHLEEGQSYRVG